MIKIFQAIRKSGASSIFQPLNRSGTPELRSQCGVVDAKACFGTARLSRPKRTREIMQHFQLLGIIDARWGDASRAEPACNVFRNRVDRLSYASPECHGLRGALNSQCEKSHIISGYIVRAEIIYRFPHWHNYWRSGALRDRLPGSVEAWTDPAPCPG